MYKLILKVISFATIDKWYRNFKRIVEDKHSKEARALKEEAREYMAQLLEKRGPSYINIIEEQNLKQGVCNTVPLGQSGIEPEPAAHWVITPKKDFFHKE